MLTLEPGVRILTAAILVVSLASCERSKAEPKPDLRLNNAALSGDLNTISRLLDGGMDADFVPAETDSFHLRTTPLEQALGAQRWEAAQLLLEQGADGIPGKDAPDSSLFIVANKGTKRMFELTLKRVGNPNARDRFGRKLIFHCLDDEEKLSSVLRFGANPNERLYPTGDTPLMLCGADATATRKVELLLRNGANPDVVNGEGRTALMSLIGNKDAALAIIRHGCKVNLKNRYGSTALHLAAARGSEEVIRALLIAGARKETRSSSGHTPYDYYLRRSGYDREVARLLRPKAQTMGPKRARLRQRGVPTLLTHASQHL